MAENKTKPTKQSVTAFIKKIPDETTRKDCETLVRLMKKITKADAVMWGSSIIAFGKYHYVYESGREGDSCLAGFSPRKGKLSIYIMGGFDSVPDLMEKLGKYKTSKGCLYVKKLSDINIKLLEKLIRGSVDYIKEKYPGR